jgi:hypothetical protein
MTLFFKRQQHRKLSWLDNDSDKNQNQFDELFNGRHVSYIPHFTLCISGNEHENTLYLYSYDYTGWTTKSTPSSGAFYYRSHTTIRVSIKIPGDFK